METGYQAEAECPNEQDIKTSTLAQYQYNGVSYVNESAITLFRRLSVAST